jgi:hypothetical protein
MEIGIMEERQECALNIVILCRFNIPYMDE